MPITREVVLYVDRRIEWFAASGEGKRDNFDAEISDCTKYSEEDKNLQAYYHTLYSVSTQRIMNICRFARGLGCEDSALEWRHANKLNRAHELRYQNS